MIARQFVAAMLAVAVWAFPARARNDALGVVMQATGAHLGFGEASAGTTIYDGDCLSTEENGTSAPPQRLGKPLAAGQEPHDPPR